MLKCAPEKSNMLNGFFEILPNKSPAFMRCNFNRDAHNDPIYERQKPIVFGDENNQDKCSNDVIPSGIGNRFYGFSRNIDVDSELKMINRKYDRCNKDDFKLSPNDVRSPLHCNRDMLLKATIVNGEVSSYGKKNIPMKCNTWNK